MRKFVTALALLAAVVGFSAKAYVCPENLYFYVSEGASTAFEKSGNTFTYTVDATQATGDVYGVIVNANVSDWDGAHAAAAYFPNGKWGDIKVSGTTDWGAMDIWDGSNSVWSNGCLQFVKGGTYEVTLTYNETNATFSGKVTTEGGQEIEEPENPVTSGMFATDKDYYVDLSGCTWATDANAKFVIWDGAQNIAATVVSERYIKFRVSQQGGTIYLKRVNPMNAEEKWNEITINAPSTDSDDCFAVNSEFKGGSWGVYVAEVEPEITGVFSTTKYYYFDTSACTWLPNAGALYYIWDGAKNQQVELLENGMAKIKLTNAGENGRIKFNRMDPDDLNGEPWNSLTITAPDDETHNLFTINDDFKGGEWGTYAEDPIHEPDPVFSDDTFNASPVTLDVNGKATIEVTLAAGEDKQYCSGQWDIVLPQGIKITDIRLNEAVCTNHTLLTNDVEGVKKCIVFSGNNTVINAGAGYMFAIDIEAEMEEAVATQLQFVNLIFNTVPTADNFDIANNLEDAIIDMNVVKAVKKIVATPANVALKVGESQSFALSFEPEDAGDTSVTWEVIAGEDLIDFADASVTAKATGVATLKVTANDGFGAFTTIDVTIDGKDVEQITLSASEHTMYVGEALTLTATVTPDDATNKAVAWSSSDEQVATVDEDGKVMAVGAGEAVITATAKDGSGVSASCTLTVKPHISGDADGDDVLTIADITIIAKQAIEIATEGAIFENMDVNVDGQITVADVTLAVYYLNLQDATLLPARAQLTANKLSLTAPVALNENEINLPLYLPEAKNVASIKFDVVLPEGFEISENSYIAPQASNGHEIFVDRVAENTYRVTIYSAHNFASNALGYLNITCGTRSGLYDFDINNVSYSDGNTLMTTDDARYTFDVTTNGVDSIFSGNANARVDVYNTAGVRVATVANYKAVKALPAGIYVVEGKKVVVF